MSKHRNSVGSALKSNRFRASLEPLEARAVPTTFTVSSLADNNVGIGNSGDLRYVIERANALNTGTPAAPDMIQFTGVSITGAAHTIRVGQGAAGRQPMPALLDAAVIDGTTVGGFDNLNGLMLTLDGHALRGNSNGLILQGGNATVRALELVNFPGDGILVASSHNIVGGDQVGKNASGQTNSPTGRVSTLPLGQPPTTPVFVRPPQGNIIAANGGDGVRIVNGANANLLEGNFIGTDVAGVNARGNGGDGVAILKADGNQLLGTTPPDKNDPFVFYNVISGNRGNGLVLDGATNTTVFANFFGLGSDNTTPLGNRLDGVLIKGNSDQTNFGANIPLGDVVAANGLNGIEVAGSASRTIIANAFAGVAAFHPTAQVGNHLDGILITTTGGNKAFGASRFSTIVLTCQSSNNRKDGIEIVGKAGGVQVSQSLIGLQTNGKAAAPNGRDGIEVRGNASAVAIGGFEPSVEGQPEEHSFLEASTIISSNRRDGVAFEGGSRGGSIVNTFIGTDMTGQGAASNGRYGLFVHANSGLRIGSALGAATPRNRNVIAFNALQGIVVAGGSGDSILGNSIFSNGEPGIVLRCTGNHHQPAPVLTSAQIGSGGASRATGILTAHPSTTYQVEIFGSPTGGLGNGQIFLGFAEVKTDATGSARFTISALANLDSGIINFLSATATSPSGDTSTFSRSIKANRGG